jgi:Flp pilus assembly protein TadG
MRRLVTPFLFKRLSSAKSSSRSDSGNVTIIFALALLPIMLSVGVAVDYARVLSAKMRLQQAVDVAAIAVAQRSDLASAGREQLAGAVVLANLGSLGGSIGPTVHLAEPSSGQYEVTASASLGATFMKLARVNSVDFGAKATSVASASTNPGAVCLLALSQTASPGLLANSSVTIDAPTCEIDVASTGNPAATFNSGDNFNVSKLCVAGTQILNNNGAMAALKTGCAVATDPFAGKLPAVTVGACTVSSQNYSGNVTLSPGVYCGGFNFNGSGTVTFQSGLYIFKGVSWNMNSGWTMNGNGVTFYFADTSYMQINSGVTANLTAPTTGTYANILIYEPSGLSTSSFTINGQAGHSFQGLIYLPSRNITFNSMSNVASEALTIVVNSVILNTLNWNLKSSAYVIPPAGAKTGAPRLLN